MSLTIRVMVGIDLLRGIFVLTLLARLRLTRALILRCDRTTLLPTGLSRGRMLSRSCMLGRSSARLLGIHVSALLRSRTSVLAARFRCWAGVLATWLCN